MLERICLVPWVSGVGGMVSFRDKFVAGLVARGVDVTFDLHSVHYDSVLVIGGTRHLAGLWRAKQRGVPIVQRLDGMNWLHRRLRTGLRHYLRAEYGNWLLAFIRNHLADRVIYQSQFARDWWERKQGCAPGPAVVVYNGVDLDTFTPCGNHQLPSDRIRMLLVEGRFQGGYELGVEHAVALVEGLVNKYGVNMELVVVGGVTPQVQMRWSERTPVNLTWAGLVPHERIPEVDRSAHLFFSADLNAACPNAVIESMACGTPVIGFDTGALPELVTAEAGRVVPYGGDPWQLHPPDIDALVGAAMAVIEQRTHFCWAARARAEAVFSLEMMVEGYLGAMR
ncbi:MAG: glycosyltransferase family 4 protein [Chloroflexota bacterium]